MKKGKLPPKGPLGKKQKKGAYPFNEQDRENLAELQRMVAEAKESLVTRLVANCAEEKRKKARKLYNSKTLKELRQLAETLLPDRVDNEDDDEDGDVQSIFAGQNAPPMRRTDVKAKVKNKGKAKVENEDDDDDEDEVVPLRVPSLNFDAEESPRRNGAVKESE